ncbi:MAG: nucleoside-diphosphate kinase [Candidatus Gracilibacteria bacterium]|nr:nucleoside-diphosphate kinase [Candidatus Gracilibacteria bacterium]
METTLVLLKPDAIQRGLIGQIVSRFENKGLKIVGMKMMQLSEEIVTEHYDFLADKPFFPGIKSYMTGSPVVAMAISGTNVIKTVRNLTGATNPSEALPGSIRGDFALTIDANIIHASDSEETAKIELNRFFKQEEITSYTKISDKTVG